MADTEKIGLEFLNVGLDSFKSDLASADKAVGNFGSTLDDQPKKANVMQAALTGAFTAVAGVAVEAMGRAASAVGDFVGGSIDVAAKFETGMSVLQAASGATDAQMKELSDTAIALGNDITLPATSASSAAEAMTELVKAGLSVEESQNAAKGALQLATAAQVDEATAAGIVANALNTFHLEGSKATEVADMLSAGANASSASITDLSDGFKQAGFIFQASNQDADDLVTALSMLTNVGLTGSDAGTALKNAMMKLNAPTKEGAAAMEALGINVFDANGKMKPLREVIGTFKTALAGMTEEQRNATLATILQSDGMKAFLPLLDAGTEGFDAMNAKVNENGAAAKMAGAQTTGFAGQQAALANTMETLQLVIGTALLPILNDLFSKYIVPGAQWLMGLVQSFIDGSGAAGQFGAILQSAGNILKFFFTDIGSAIDFAQILGEQLGLSDEAIVSFMDIVSSLGDRWTEIQAAIASVIAGIQALIVAIFGEVQKFLEAHGDEIKAVMADAWQLIQEIIQTAAAFYEKVIGPALQQVAAFITAHSAQIQAIFTTAWNVIKFVITTAINLIRTILQVTMKLINGDTAGALDQIKSIFINVWNDISKAVQDIITGLSRAISSKLTEISNSISGAFTSAFEAIKNQLNDWIKLGEGIISSIVSGISNSVGQLINTLRSAVLSAFNAALSIFPAPIAAAIRQFLGISGNVAQRVTAFNGAASYGGAGGSKTTAFNLSVNSGQSTGSIIQDFAIMRAMA